MSKIEKKIRLSHALILSMVASFLTAGLSIGFAKGLAVGDRKTLAEVKIQTYQNKDSIIALRNNMSKLKETDRFQTMLIVAIAKKLKIDTEQIRLNISGGK